MCDELADELAKDSPAHDLKIAIVATLRVNAFLKFVWALEATLVDEDNLRASIV